jgi:hypothetical protein
MDLEKQKVLARARARLRRERQELTGTEKAAAFAGEFTESAFGIGDELGAIGRGIGGSIYDILKQRALKFNSLKKKIRCYLTLLQALA